ncbi:hypothetical protein LCGC14_0586130 [marine sediment metagenome]|uniref:Uncharacterized protein n=1 Tax=marine sediment metagenome TaxID=412755 RepID=A0A0F9RYK6_9ZZZZ
MSEIKIDELKFETFFHDKETLKRIKSALKLQDIMDQDLIDWKSSSEMKAECGTAMMQEPIVKAIYSVLKSMKERSKK